MSSHDAIVEAVPASSRMLLTVGAFAAVYLIWGSTYLAILYSLESFPPFIMLGIRFGVAGLLLLAVLRLRGVQMPGTAEIKSSMLLGALMLGVGTGSIAWAEKFIPTGLAALLVATVPLWIVLLQWIWLKDTRPRTVVLLALVAGLAGVMLVVPAPDLTTTGTMYFVAVGVALVGSLSWSIGSLLGKRLNMPSSPFMAAALQMIFGGLFLTLLGFSVGEHHVFSVSGITTTSVLSVLYLIVFGSLIGFSAFVWLLKHVPPARVATYAFVNPIVAVVLGTLVAGEALTPRIGLAGLLLVTSVMVIVSSGRFGRANGFENLTSVPAETRSAQDRIQDHIRRRRDEIRINMRKVYGDTLVRRIQDTVRRSPHTPVT
jgi:drug/metabolite transporter (DMT)-like permease